ANIQTGVQFSVNPLHDGKFLGGLVLGRSAYRLGRFQSRPLLTCKSSQQVHVICQKGNPSLRLTSFKHPDDPFLD
ncbi:MAG: hypothetical protein RMJ60_04080, partial [Anaerolineales bacterium]|nr:hypothetical protein [Anaerolineales bacterium]